MKAKGKKGSPQRKRISQRPEQRSPPPAKTGYWWSRLSMVGKLRVAIIAFVGGPFALVELYSYLRPNVEIAALQNFFEPTDPFSGFFEFEMMAALRSIWSGLDAFSGRPITMQSERWL
jgi:hypothetical protein